MDEQCGLLLADSAVLLAVSGAALGGRDRPFPCPGLTVGAPLSGSTYLHADKNSGSILIDVACPTALVSGLGPVSYTHLTLPTICSV
eukprot:3651857-Rhodomonas_salina.1